jgi:hypothetical protein
LGEGVLIHKNPGIRLRATELRAGPVRWRCGGSIFL